MTSTLYLHLIQKMKLSLSSLVAHSELKAAPFALLMKPLLFLTLPPTIVPLLSILYPGTLSAIQPTFSDGFNLFLVQAKCFGQFYLEKVSQLVVILRITGNRKTTLWFESLETRVFATTKKGPRFTDNTFQEATRNLHENFTLQSLRWNLRGWK